MPPSPSTSDTLKPWQFFTLGGLICATAAVFVMRGTSPGNIVLACLGIFAAALVGLGTLRTLRPLVTGDVREPEMVGGQTRAALEREKNLILRSIKELEFDHAMGKVAAGDYEEMVARLRARAVRLLKQLDGAGSGYRELIERELARRLVKAGGTTVPDGEAGLDEETRPEAEGERQEAGTAGTCATCGTSNDSDARFCKGCGTKLLALLLAVLTLAAPVFAQLQMPDPKEMAGIPRPVSDLADGHVSVRLIRGQLSNNIQGHPVEVHVGEKVLTQKTDENGRAEFSGVAPGAVATAVAVVDGERLVSQEFSWPGRGGIRLMLVATLAGGASSPERQAQQGNVVFGDQTRIILDVADDMLQIYYVLDIQNPARVPVNPPQALIVDMPAGALGTSVLGGAPQAVAIGDRVTVKGPFAPGETPVQVAYQMLSSNGDLSLTQTLPLPVPSLAVLMKKLGDMTLTSPQLPSVQEREFDGEKYLLAQGPGLPAGGALTLTITGLPHHSPLPRRIALTVALLMIGGGFWAAMRAAPRGANAARVKQLTGRREKAFNELVRLEQQRRLGSLDATRYAERRQTLVAQLERVYRDLDAERGQGLAA